MANAYSWRPYEKTNTRYMFNCPVRHPSRDIIAKTPPFSTSESYSNRSSRPKQKMANAYSWRPYEKTNTRYMFNCPVRHPSRDIIAKTQFPYSTQNKYIYDECSLFISLPCPAQFCEFRSENVSSPYWRICIPGTRYTSSLLHTRTRYVLFRAGRGLFYFFSNLPLWQHLLADPARMYRVCVYSVVYIKPFFLPVDIQHNQCPGQFFNSRRDTRSVVKKVRHRYTTSPRMYAVSTEY